MGTALRFPDGFFWGAATSSHQVEGNQENDWSEWEKLGKVNDGSMSGRAADHWNRYAADFDIAKSLGHNAHRFSLEWSRIEPQLGQWDEKAIGHYRDVVKALRERGMEPFATLWHFTSPLWFMARRGWENPDAPQLFARYCAKALQALPEVKFWLTVNEPNVYALLSYLIGYWPPEVKSWLRGLRVYRHLAQAHRLAYEAMKSANPDVQVGYSQSLIDYVPARPGSFLDRLATRFSDRWYNRWFMKRTADRTDCIGVNHYVRQGMRVVSLRKPLVTEARGEPLTDYGWGICPEAMYEVLLLAAKYRKPLYITENGVADAADMLRRKFIQDELAQVLRAMQDGADVRGYFHWSLLDNFEWREGFSKRFGLVNVDFSTQERTVRPSARWFAGVCTTNTLTG